MLIRPAVHGDELALIEFSQLCYNEMQFDDNGFKFEYAAGLRNYEQGIDDNSKLILTAWDSGVLVGATVWLLSDRTQYFDTHRIASEIVLHALPSLSATRKMKIMMRLRSSVEVFCRSFRVKSMYFQYDIRFPAVGRMMEHAGFRPMAIQMVKILEA